MRLSVVMAVCDGEQYLREAVESVLGQSISDFEFLIVDDGSTDGTAAILAEYARRDCRIRVLRNERALGPYPSANRGLLEARGDIIARHDGDDVSPPDRFAIQLEALRTSDDVSLVTGAVRVFGPYANGDVTYSPPPWQPRFEWELLFGNPVSAGAHVMFPRILNGRPVQFPARHRYSEDYGMWCSLSQLGRVVCPPAIVYRYRRHECSISTQKSAEQLECMMQIRQAEQSRFLSNGIDRATSTALGRFWRPDDSVGLGRGAATLDRTLGELRAAFLAYVGERFGAADKAALQQEIDGIYSKRLGYWFYRSVTWFDTPAAVNLFMLACARREPVGVSLTAGSHLLDALRRKAGLGEASQ